MKSCVEIFEAMGMGTIETYENDLEAPLIESTKEYYQQYVDQCIINDTTPIYLIRIEKIIDNERNRIHSYLNLITESKLFHVLDNVLIETKLTILIDKEGSGLRILLQNDRLEDIIRMFHLFHRIKGGLGVNMMAEVLRDYIIQLGNDIILERKLKLDTLNAQKENTTTTATSTATGTGPAASGEGKGGGATSTSTPNEKLNSEKEMYLIDVQYLKDLMNIHDKYLNIIKSHLQNHSSFHKSIKDSFINILNHDMSKINNIQILNTFCDNILKKDSYEKITSENEIEIFLEKLVQLFTYLTDKDLFNEIYRNLLAKRLLSQRSSSDDMERLMISKLKLRCGSQFTSKIEGMLTDLSIANDHQEKFSKYLKDKEIILSSSSSSTSTSASSSVSSSPPIEFSVQVLTTGYWPTYKVYDISLPPVMNNCCKVWCGVVYCYY